MALKVLPHEMAKDPELLERFRREAKALAALDHSNIVTVHTVEDTEGIHFITMSQDAGELAGKLTALREAVAHHPRISTGLGHLSALLPWTRSVRIGLAGVVVALVAALSLTIWPLRKGTSVPGDGPRISSLAVLPLRNSSYALDTRKGSILDSPGPINMTIEQRLSAAIQLTR